MKNKIRLCSLVLCLLFGPLAYLFITARGMTFLNWFLPAAFLVWLLLLGIWFLIFGKPAFKIRLLRFFASVGAFILLAIIANKTLRYEGSASGSSFPKFSWVWNKKPTQGSGDLVQSVTTTSGIPSDAIDRASENLHNFLGPDRNGKWPQAHFDPDWKANPPKLIWRRGVGKAWSSFVVHGNQAVTQQQNGDNEEILCLDLVTGSDLWRHSDSGVRLLLEKAENEGAAMGGDGPRSTPTIYGNKVFSLGSTGVANCLNLNDGSLVWSRNVIREFSGEVQRWGSANAPLTIPSENLVVFAGTDSPGATLIACDADTGETRWVYRGNGASYSSPRILTIEGTEQIVSVNAKDVTGLNIKDGSVFWKYEWPGMFPKVAQPLLVGKNRLLVTASYGMGSHLLEFSKEGNQWQVEEIWKSTRMKTKFSSAVIMDQHAYGLDEGRLACIDLETGKKVWKGEKFGFGQNLFFGDYLLIQAEAGDVVMGSISTEGFAETGRIEALSKMTWNAPAVAGRILIVRNDSEAACYLLPEKAGAN